MHPNATALLLGITDSASEGDWKLFNGNPTTYIGHWSSQVGEPNGGVYENYAVMYTKKGLNYIPQANLGDWKDEDEIWRGWSYCTFEPIQFRGLETLKIDFILICRN